MHINNLISLHIFPKKNIINILHQLCGTADKWDHWWQIIKNGDAFYL